MQGGLEGAGASQPQLHQCLLSQPIPHPTPMSWWQVPTSSGAASLLRPYSILLWIMKLSLKETSLLAFCFSGCQRTLQGTRASFCPGVCVHFDLKMIPQVLMVAKTLVVGASLQKMFPSEGRNPGSRKRNPGWGPCQVFSLNCPPNIVFCTFAPLSSVPFWEMLGFCWWGPKMGHERLSFEGHTWLSSQGL